MADLFVCFGEAQDLEPTNAGGTAIRPWWRALVRSAASDSSASTDLGFARGIVASCDERAPEMCLELSALRRRS